MLNIARRMLRKRPDILPIINESISRRNGEIEGSSNVTSLSGPAAQLQWAAAQLEWNLLSASLLSTHNGELVDLLNIDEEELLHTVRERLRTILWCDAARRRPDMAGLERPEGVDRAATCALLQTGSYEDRRLLERVMAGAIMSRERKHKRKKAPSPICTFCWGDTAGPETVRHVLHECAGFRNTREGMPVLPADAPP